MRPNPYIPDHWSPEQALAVYEFLDELQERIRDRYGEQITERGTRTDRHGTVGSGVDELEVGVRTA